MSSREAAAEAHESLDRVEPVGAGDRAWSSSGGADRAVRCAADRRRARGRPRRGPSPRASSCRATGRAVTRGAASCSLRGGTCARLRRAAACGTASARSRPGPGSGSNNAKAPSTIESRPGANAGAITVPESRTDVDGSLTRRSRSSASMVTTNSIREPSTLPCRSPSAKRGGATLVENQPCIRSVKRRPGVSGGAGARSPPARAWHRPTRAPRSSARRRARRARRS